MSLFAKAKVLEAPAKPSKKNDKVEHKLVGLHDYAVICDLIENLVAVKETLGADVKLQMRTIFSASKTRPENFRGVDGDAQASCELRKRSTASPLKDGEVEVLLENHVPFGEEVVQKEMYVVNPAYLQDQDMLERVSKALEKVKGLPEDFIMLQQGVTKKVVVDETVEKVFEGGLAGKLFDTVAVMAIKPKLEKFDVKQAIERAKQIVLGG